jgi:hypothetical protein
MSLTSRIFLIAIFAVSLLGGYGCGSSSNNDQGTSFTALGFFVPGTAGGTGQNGTIIPLFSDVSETDGLSNLTSIGVQNRLQSQFIRVVRVDCSYDVQGSSLNIPDDSEPLGSIVEAGGSSFIAIQVISPDIFSFLNNNQNSLPQLPFKMTVTCSVTGVTQAGDVLTTNPVHYPVQFVDTAEFFGGGPTVNGPGTGGTVNFEQGGTGTQIGEATGESEFLTGEEGTDDVVGTGNISNNISDDSDVISF